MKTVAVLVESFNAYGRGLCQGIADYAAGKAGWSLIWFEIYQGLKDVSATIKYMRSNSVDGILLRGPIGTVRGIWSLGIPTIDLSNDLDSGVTVIGDEAALADMAIEYFTGCGFLNFAFCGFTGVPFSDIRERHFVEDLHRRNFKVWKYKPQGKDKPQGKELRQEGILKKMQAGFHETESLIRWLRQLPKPVCILACNDARALQLLIACQLGAINVPKDVAVLGVDNDELVAGISRPSLSSIEQNTKQIAQKACYALDRLMQGLKVAHRRSRIAPLRIVERSSTNIIGTRDTIVSEAHQVIRQEACNGLTVKDLVTKVGISRTNLQVRFKRALGRTIHDEIASLRVKRICQLLCTTEYTLEEISSRVGYLDVSHMCKSFRRLNGMAPGQYRKYHKSHAK
jgi:LacI family transcriptional regulator